MLSWKWYEYLFVVILLILGMRVFIKEDFYRKYSTAINVSFLVLLLVSIFIRINLINQSHRLRKNVLTLEKKTKDIEILPSGRTKIGGIITGEPINVIDKLEEAQDNIENGNLKKALDLIGEAEALDTEKVVPVSHLLRAKILIRMEEFKRALYELNIIKPEQIHQDNKQSYYFFLGICYGIVLKDYDRAKENFQKAIDLNTNLDVTKQSKYNIEEINRITGTR